MKLYFLSAALLLLLVVFVSSSQSKKFLPLKFDQDNECIRKYKFDDFDHNSSSFTVSGKSIYGRLFDWDKNNGSFHADVNGFSFKIYKKSVVFRHTYKSVDIVDIPNSKKDNVTGSFFTSDYRLYAVAEYEETNGVEGFQYEEDKLEGWMYFGAESYTFNITNTSLNTTLNNGTDTQFNTYSIAATSTNNITILRFTFSDAPVSIDNVDLNSQTVKIDVEINNYFDSDLNKPSSSNCGKVRPFDCLSTGPSSNNNTRLALFTSFLIAGGTAQFENKGAGGRFRVHGPILSRFDFVTEAVVNGNETIPIITNKSHFHPHSIPKFYSLLDDSFNDNKDYSGLLMVHSFDQIRPSSVFWDPEVGAEPSESFASHSIKVPHSLLLLALLIIYTMLL